eukprot:762996-Hanusia_phi.AAC.1
MQIAAPYYDTGCHIIRSCHAARAACGGGRCQGRPEAALVLVAANGSSTYYTASGPAAHRAAPAGTLIRPRLCHPVRAPPAPRLRHEGDD